MKLEKCFVASFFHWLDARLLNKRAAINGRFLWYGFLILVLSVNVSTYSRQTGHAGESAADPEKLAIIRLIEDRLAAALTIWSEKDAPDFGTLDRIYPEWHHGEPAKQRRQWTFHDYQYYMVIYSVHSVWINRPNAAIVKGNKKVRSSRKISFLKFFRDTKMETFEIQFTITCRRNSLGLWEIMKETEIR